MTKRSETGTLGERLACTVLKKRGYHIIETNFRCREGEIDIVARQKNCLVFVEVRTKTKLDFGTPEESITTAKRRKMRVSALRYRQSHPGLPELWRIDFVAVELNDHGKATRIEIFENAVGEE
jgi:putative endonuclease